MYAQHTTTCMNKIVKHKTLDHSLEFFILMCMTMCAVQVKWVFFSLLFSSFRCLNECVAIVWQHKMVISLIVDKRKNKIICAFVRIYVCLSDYVAISLWVRRHNEFFEELCGPLFEHIFFFILFSFLSSFNTLRHFWNHKTSKHLFVFFHQSLRLQRLHEVFYLPIVKPS